MINTGNPAIVIGYPYTDCLMRRHNPEKGLGSHVTEYPTQVEAFVPYVSGSKNPTLWVINEGDRDSSICSLEISDDQGVHIIDSCKLEDAIKYLNDNHVGKVISLWTEGQ